MANNNLKSIGIFGLYGNENLGDEAIITAVIGNIRLRLPDANKYYKYVNNLAEFAAMVMDDN